MSDAWQTSQCLWLTSTLLGKSTYRLLIKEFKCVLKGWPCRNQFSSFVAWWKPQNWKLTFNIFSKNSKSICLNNILYKTEPRFRFQFFFMNQFPQAPEYTTRVVSNFFLKFVEIFTVQGAPRVGKWKKILIIKVLIIFLLDIFG